MAVTQTNPATNWIAFGPFLLLPGQRGLQRDGKPVHIGDKVLDLLMTLIERPGEVYSKPELAERVWQRQLVEDVNIRATVATLRKLLGHTADGGDYIVNVVGRGYCFSAAVPVERWPRVFSKPSAPGGSQDGRASGRLPSLLTPVIGRQDEIHRIARLLGQHRLVTIVGPGGIGKTTVGISLAFQLAESEGGVCFIDFAPIQDPHLVHARIATALGSDRVISDPVRYILDHLSEKQRLMVLDNCEHIAQPVAEIVEAILVSAARVKILATSREPLRAEGEIVYRLDCLTYPLQDSDRDSKSALAYSAVQLFVERTQSVLIQFVLTDSLAAPVVEICRRLDGIALAIQLAASRVPAFGVMGVASRLDDRFQLLKNGLRTALPRHRTLEAVFDWSFELLTADEQRVFERISVFPATFTIEAATEVVGWPPIAAPKVAPIVGDLVAKSLVIFAGDEQNPSYRLLETVRAYAQARLSAAGDAAEIATRHARRVIVQSREFCLRISREGKAAGSDSWAIINDLRAAFQWAFDCSNQGIARDLLSAAATLMMHLGLTYELRAWIMRALDDETNTEGRLTLLLNLGGALLHSGCDLRTLMHIYDDALALAERRGDIDSALQALWGRFIAAWANREPHPALLAARRFHEIACANGFTNDVLVGECLIGSSLHTMGDQKAAEPYLRNVIERYNEEAVAADLPRYPYNHRAVSLRFIAYIEWLTGRVDTASITANQAIAEAGDHLPTVFMTLAHCAGIIAIERCDWAAAALYVDESYRRCGHHPRWRLWADALAAILSVKTDQSESGLHQLESVMANPDGYLLPNEYVWYRVELIKARMVSHRLDDARMLVDSSISHFHQKGEFWLTPELLRLRGILNADMDANLAEESFKEAINIARSQKALTLELRAAVDYFRIIKRQELKNFVADAFGRLSEGFGSPEALSARELLSQ